MMASKSGEVPAKAVFRLVQTNVPRSASEVAEEADFRFLSHRASLCRGRKNPRNLPHSEGIQLARVAVVLRRPLAEEQGNLVVPHVLDPRSRLQGSRDRI